MVQQKLDSVLIVGGTGKVAKYMVPELLKDPHFTRVGITTRANSMNDTKKKLLDSYEAQGVHVNILDYENEASLTSVLEEYTTVVSFVEEGDFAFKIVDLASQSGIQRFVPNVWGVDYVVNNHLSFLAVREKVREHIVKCGMEYTEFMVGFFLENISVKGAAWIGVDLKEGKATFYGNGDAPVSWTHRRDAVKFFVAALKNPSQSRNRTYRVEGSRASVKELADLFDARSEQKLKRSLISYDEIREKNLKMNDEVDFAVMGGSGTAVVNPNGEQLDNALFAEIVPTTVSEWIVELYQ
ncbi:hypothetical protein BC833DRAFT_564373 [Globomyces pollinis-pini]|nr:hypothetical protein BC833DRAFT_564373 [Globomyces pollinis-pini]